MRKVTIILITAIYAITTSAYAQNYDEAKVGNYPLPDPLTFTDGKKVKNKKHNVRKKGEAGKNEEKQRGCGLAGG